MDISLLCENSFNQSINREHAHTQTSAHTQTLQTPQPFYLCCSVFVVVVEVGFGRLRLTDFAQSLLCCCFLHINRSGLNHTVLYVVANPVRGLLDRKISEKHLLIPSFNESKIKTQTNKNDKEKGTRISKYICQKKIADGHSTERVWHSASREPSDTLPGSQPCAKRVASTTTFRTLRVSVFTINNGTIDVA